MKDLTPSTKKNAIEPNPAALLFVVHKTRTLRIPTPVLPPRPIYTGSRKFLRALRSAEMAMWEATGGDYFHSPVAN